MAVGSKGDISGEMGLLFYHSLFTSGFSSEVERL